MITELYPEPGGEAEGIMRVTVSLPASRDELRSLWAWLAEQGFSPDADQLDQWHQDGAPISPPPAPYPPFPADGVCPACQGTEWQVQEDGYMRFTTAEWDSDEGVLHAHINGTADWSDGGEGEEWVMCANFDCMEPFARPEEIEWD